MLRRLVATASIALVLSCASPTLPLPPPEDISAIRVDATFVKLSAPCNGAPPDVTIVVINQNTNGVSGATADTCGAWVDANVVANRGDRLSVTYENQEISQPATVFAP